MEPEKISAAPAFAPLNQGRLRLNALSRARCPDTCG